LTEKTGMHQTGCLKLSSEEPDIRIIDSRRKQKAKIKKLKLKAKIKKLKLKAEIKRLKLKAEIKRLKLQVKNGKSGKSPLRI